jgi:hypothetical protein
MSALGLFVPKNGLHLDEIDHADESVLCPDGQLNRDRVAAQARADLVHAAQKIRTRPVHLVDERDPRDAVLVHLAPHGLGLGLHARHRAIHRDRRIQHAQAPLHLDGEVDVAGGVDDVDPVLGKALVHPLPEARGGRGRDGDAALLFLFHVVHDCRTVVHLADLVRDPGVEQDSFGRSRLARVDVRRDTDIAISLDGRRT